MNEHNPAIYAALAKAQAIALAVEKDARNQFHKYNYASAEALIHEAKAALSQCGLAVVPSVSNISDPTEAQAKSGAVGVLTATWVVVHQDGGAMTVACHWPIIPEKGRPFDKALAAARTASLGYLLRDLLQLPRVEEGTDLDHDSRDNRQEQRPAPPRRDPAPEPPKPDNSDVVAVVVLADAIANTMGEGDMASARKQIPEVCAKSARASTYGPALRAMVERRELGDEFNAGDAAEELAKLDDLVKRYRAKQDAQ